MKSKKGGGVTVTISKPSAAIALKYGENVSRGIREMERVIEEQRTRIELLVQSNPYIVSEEQFKLEEELSHVDVDTDGYGSR